MATTTRRERPARALVTLALLTVILAGALLAGTRWSDATLTPQLALDLEGGTQIILTPVAEDGARVTEDAITQAIEIIRQRVDASGVAEAEITSQGGTNIVVGLPGQPDEATLDLVRESAQMQFRPVLVVSAPGPIGDTTATDDATTDDATTDAADDTVAEPADDAARDDATDEGAAEPAEDVADDAADDAATDTATDTAPAPDPENPSDPAWLTDELLAEFQALDCTDPANLTGGSARVAADNVAFVACDEQGTAKYALGPVEVRGDMIESASSGLGTTQFGAITNEWITTVKLDDEGKEAFREATTRLSQLSSPMDQFAVVLDGLVVLAPAVNEPIPNGEAQITGSFTRTEAATLARQLNFGALPLTFRVQEEQQISATLGSEQLERGLLAGLIGLVLVGIYSIGQYRTLGAVTIASLVIAGVLTYLTITLLSWVQGYRLSLPGVAGIIVAIGITADSFIVYFERIRDELREGRTLPAAVDAGWHRARRTILASDAVSFLAAVVLYFLAVGGVRGFAFTLGLTTLIDLVVVFMFTHPLMILLARTRYFGLGHPLSGLDPVQLGTPPRHLGRGQVTTARRVKQAAQATSPDRAGPQGAGDEARPAGARQTIAERRAAEQRALAGRADERNEH